MYIPEEWIGEDIVYYYKALIPIKDGSPTFLSISGKLTRIERTAVGQTAIGLRIDRGELMLPLNECQQVLKLSQISLGKTGSK